MYTLFCDGACRNNQSKTNIGGYGVVFYNDANEELWSLQHAEANTTNNKMELLACIKGLERVINDNSGALEITLCTDSSYVIAGMTQWIHNWLRNGWRTSTGKPVANADYWKQLLTLSLQITTLQWEHVKGHYGIEGNERADSLANEAMNLLSV